MATLSHVLLDTRAADAAVLCRARAVMHQLLLPCLADPLDAEALHDAWRIQREMAADVAAASARLDGRRS